MSTGKQAIKACMDEVTHLHQYLQAWLKGEIGTSGESPMRLAEALDENFTVVHPSGVEEGKPAVLENFRAAHGSRNGDFRILVRDVVPLLAREELVVVCYTEIHEGENPHTRRSTAILEALPGGRPRWKHLHESRFAA